MQRPKHLFIVRGIPSERKRSAARSLFPSGMDAVVDAQEYAPESGLAVATEGLPERAVLTLTEHLKTGYPRVAVIGVFPTVSSVASCEALARRYDYEPFSLVVECGPTPALVPAAARERLAARFELML